MSRAMAAANVTAAASSHVVPILFVEIQFDSGTVRAHDHIGPIVWNSQTWNGLGAFAQVSPLQESEARSAHQVQLQLSGIDSTIVDEARTQEIFERDVVIYLGFMNSDGALAADPDERWRGYCDNMEISLGGDMDTITLNAESERIRDQKANGLLWSDDAQQKLYSGDTGFQYLAQMIDARVWWGPGGRESTVGTRRQSAADANVEQDYISQFRPDG